MKFFIFFIFLPILFSISVVFSADVSRALFRTTFVATNIGDDRTNFAVGFPISGNTLVSGGYINSTALNAVVQAGEDLPSMPPTDRIDVENLITYNGTSFTSYSAAAINNTINDVPLAPTAAGTGTATYFGFHHGARILTVNTTTGGTGTYSHTWEYSRGNDQWGTLTNIVDATNGFRNIGIRSISWNVPLDWVSTNVTGSGVDSFFVRARISSISTLGVVPLAARMWWETGVWSVFVGDLDEGEQHLSNLFMGGPNMVDHHQIFPGTAGVTSSDAAVIELGNTFGIVFNGRLSFASSAINGCLICKGTDFRVYPSGSGQLTLQATGSGGVTLSVSGITLPATGSQEVIVGSNPTNITLSVTGFGSATGAAQNIPDNTQNFTWGASGSAVYIDSIRIEPDDPATITNFNSQSQWASGTETDTEAIAGVPTNRGYRVIETVASNDAEWRTDETTYVNASDFMRVGVPGGVSTNFLIKFDNVQISSSTLIAASFSVTPRSTQSGTTPVLIRAADSCDAVAPGSAAAANSAAKTTASVSWSIPTWTINVVTTSPDLSPIFNELVTDCGGLNGDVVIFILDNGASGVAHREAFQAQLPGATSADITNGDWAELSITTVNVSDFLRLELTPTLTAAPFWTNTLLSGSGGFALVSDITSKTPFPKRSLLLNSGTAAAYNRRMSQDVVASSGQIWGGSVWHTNAQNGGGGAVSTTHRLRFIWLNSSFVEISNVVVSDSTLDTVFEEMELSSQTAPAGTVYLRFAVEVDCTASCNSVLTYSSFDDAIACVCAVAPDYPNILNRLTNGGFGEFDYTGRWISPTITPTTVNNVASTTVTWDIETGTNTSYTVESSINNQATWQTISSSGGSIPGITVGQDLATTNINIRLTLSATGSAAGTDTPYADGLSVSIVDLGAADLRYELNQLPGLTVTDRSGNGNHGTMSYSLNILGSVLNEVNVTVDSIEPILVVTLDPGQQPSAPSIIGNLPPPTDLFTSSTGSDLPFFEPISTAAVGLGISTNSLYSILILFVAVVVGLGSFLATGNIIVVVAGAGLIMVFGLYADILEGWIVITYAMTAIFFIGVSRSV